MKRPSDDRPTAHVPPGRRPIHAFGQRLIRRRKDGQHFTGRVDVIYADYWAARYAFAVPDGWFEMQNEPPSTKDQVFYSLVALDGKGGILAGEREVEEA